MKPQTLASTLLVAVWVLSAPALQAEQTVVRSASEYDYPPFAVTDAKGKADGFSVELLRAALKAMGHEVEFKVGPWHVLKQELAEGKLQVLPLMARTAEREAVYDLSVPYFTMHGTIIVRAGETRIRTLADLKDREVLVMRGDIAEEYLSANGPPMRFIRTVSVEESLSRLARGESDAVVVQKLVAKSLMGSLKIDNLETVGPPLANYQNFCFAVRKGDAELLSVLNEGLALVTADGTYEALQDKWLGPVTEERFPYGLVAGAVVLTLVLAWAVGYLWQRSLRIRVKASTVELQAANDTLSQEIWDRWQAEQALLRKTEELEAMFANIHMCVAVMDREFRFLRVNRAYAEAARMPAAELVGKNHFALYPHEENERIFSEVVESGIPFSISAKPFEHPAQPERGTTYWDWMLSPIHSADGRVEGVVHAIIDVTEREQQRRAAEAASHRAQEELEQRVRERTAELEAANQELETFSYSVSHDLRGPLRAINGFSQILADDYQEAIGQQGRQYIERIRHATVRMGELIDGLLNLARVFRRDVESSTVHLSSLAEEVAGQLREEVAAGAVFRIQPALNAQGDPTLLRVLLQNLLGNAMKFSAHRDPPVIEFGRERRAEGDVFFLRDNGLGFDMQYAHKLFLPFERLHTDNAFEGTGIGLATVRRIVLRHRGRIWAEGAVDGGATFYFTLGQAPVSPS